MAEDNGKSDKKCAELEKLLSEARAESQYFQKVARQTGRTCLREVDQLSQVIAQKNRTEKELKKSKEKYKTIVESIEEGYFEMDLSGKLTFFNDSVPRMTGYSKKKLLSMKISDYTTPESNKRILQALKNIHITKKTKKILNHSIIRKDKEISILALSAAIITDEEEKATGFRGVVRDITKQIYIERERKRIENQLTHTGRMEALGTLSGGIAHDFNNLLMGIQGNISLMLISDDSANLAYENIQSIQRCVNSGAHLTKQLLDFAKGGTCITAPTDLNEIVEKTSGMFWRTKKDIIFHINLQKHIWTVKADRGQIEQVLLNIYINAWQAMPQGGVLHLQTENIVLGEKDVENFGQEQGRYVKISIKDSGTGMDKKTKQRIFEPFFTTKEKGTGTGLGLASALGIINSHAGIIKCCSTKGKGTTFNIFLPASEIETEKKEISVCGMRHGTETILLVDDEDIILY